MWQLEITESQGYSATLRIPIIDICTGSKYIRGLPRQPKPGIPESEQSSA